MFGTQIKSIFSQLGIDHIKHLLNDTHHMLVVVLRVHISFEQEPIITNPLELKHIQKPLINIKVIFVKIDAVIEGSVELRRNIQPQMFH